MDFKINQTVLGKDDGKLIMPSNHKLFLLYEKWTSWVVHAAGLEAQF